MFRSWGDAASRHASRSAAGISVDASSSASVVPAPIVRPEIPRRHGAAHVDERVCRHDPVAQQRHELRAARERASAGERGDRLRATS